MFSFPSTPSATGIAVIEWFYLGRDAPALSDFAHDSICALLVH